VRGARGKGAPRNLRRVSPTMNSTREWTCGVGRCGRSWEQTQDKEEKEVMHACMYDQRGRFPSRLARGGKPISTREGKERIGMEGPNSNEHKWRPVTQQRGGRARAGWHTRPCMQPPQTESKVPSDSARGMWRTRRPPSAEGWDGIEKWFRSIPPKTPHVSTHFALL
jgi:hypothetical protein